MVKDELREKVVTIRRANKKGCRNCNCVGF